MMSNYLGGGFGFGFGWIFMIVFWGLIIWTIIVLARGFSGSGHSGCCGHKNHNPEHFSGDKQNSAVDILKERYAKGEINKEQFEQIKKDLQ